MAAAERAGHGHQHDARRERLAERCTPIVTVLLMALPIALSTTLEWPFSVSREVPYEM